MDTSFKYFHWAIPTPDQPLYALYDVFDNHLILQSYDYNRLFCIKTLFRSKTILDIVKLSNVPDLIEKNLIDNSVVEKWGVDTPMAEFFVDCSPGWAGHNDAEAYYQIHIAESNIQLTESQTVFDTFKIDLQKQLFFAHHCLTFDPNPTVLTHFASAVSLGVNYSDVVDQFLDLTTITNREVKRDLIDFLKVTCLFYE
jgi:hypothetical protein